MSPDLLLKEKHVLEHIKVIDEEASCLFFDG
jgi:hypothetical protein